MMDAGNVQSFDERCGGELTYTHITFEFIENAEDVERVGEYVRVLDEAYRIMRVCPERERTYECRRVPLTQVPSEWPVPVSESNDSLAKTERMRARWNK